jgi:hypothetical protein
MQNSDLSQARLQPDESHRGASKIAKRGFLLRKNRKNSFPFGLHSRNNSS